MANLTPQGGNADLAGRTVTTIDGYEVTYDAAGFARRSVSPDGQVKNYDALGNQVGFPTTLEVSPAIDPTAPVLPVSTQMPITDTIPASSIQQTPSETTSPYGEENEPPAVVDSTSPAAVDPNADSEFGNLDTAQAAAADSAQTVTQEDIDAGLDEALAAQGEEEDNAPRIYGPEDLGVEELSDEARSKLEAEQAVNRASLQSEDNLNAAAQAATIARAKEQAAYAARYKSPSNADWRVRLVLAEGATYLYKDPQASNGILAPLAKSNGVIFPYTPQIQTAYTANYDKYDLTHSNYRGYFYKNSAVNDININAVFTAQDTAEAQYLLAVIHFFRAATKMFYGQDPLRGAPPPILYLVGLGEFQFNGHACVISNFQYNLPSDVDYIRATNPNDYGSNMLNRVSPMSATSSLLPPSINRLANAIDKFGSFLKPGALTGAPQSNDVPGTVTNSNRATYVPTKIELNISLLPVQTRSQVSKQFSNKEFANGNLLKGGFW